jgi:uncharacterized membrane protein YdjX (TVP38/TMEM64 family)
MTRDARLRMAIFITVTVLVAVAYVAVARHWFSIDFLRMHRDAAVQFTRAHYWQALALVAAACVVCVAASAPVSGVFMLLCGMLFGRWMGTVIVILSAALGATLAMLMVRYLVQDLVRARVRRYVRARRLLVDFERQGAGYLLFLRVAPGFPFWLTNVLIGLTTMPAWRFLLLTLVGLIPDSIIYCNIGTNLATLQSTRDLISPGSILALTLLAILCLVPVLIHELKRRKVLRADWPFGHR